MKKTADTSGRMGLIGPLLPYRGGIAQHTTMLRRTLSQKSDLLTISFKRLYPKWLYPGKNDIDEKLKGYQEPGVSYVLDSLNPLTWIQTCGSLTDHSARAVIIPWWTVFLAPCFGFIAHRLRRKGVQVIFLCHNVKEHEPSLWKEIVTRWVLSGNQLFLVHTKSDADILAAMVPNSRIGIHPHPVYSQFPKAEKAPIRRARLELLFYGFVRPYKGLDVLIKAMQLLKHEDIFLTIAGELWDHDESLLNGLTDKNLLGKIEVVDHYIGEEETARYFSRADVVVLPYRSSSGTGVIPLAYHYGKPVIATLVGGLSEVVVDGVSGRLVRPEDPSALAGVIQEFLYNPPSLMLKGVERIARDMTWEGFVHYILDFIRS
jgi:glycosyltransferase involved in cell wall biosynthesis